MRVAIVEIMDTGHVPLAEALCSIFCSHRENRVEVFTLQRHVENLKHLGTKFPGLSFNIKTRSQSVKGFLDMITSSDFDRVYVVTLTKFFPSFANWNLKNRLFLVIHNLDEWFSLSLLDNSGKFISGILKMPEPKLFLYLLKLHFLIPRHKKKILDLVSQTNGSVVVLSESVRNEAIKMHVSLKIEVVPFSVYDNAPVSVESDNTKPLRLCIPGIISQYRRNYLGLLDLAEKQLGKYKKEFILDFLGGIQPGNLLNDSKPVVEKAEELKQKGFKIIIRNTEFIPVEEYDRELAMADIILGNMNVILNSHSRYGRTKETGLPFAMIKAAKPGIFPVDYPIPGEIISGTIRYESYEHLGKIIARLLDNRQEVNDLKELALENSKHFSPERIYKKLTGIN